MPTNLPLYLDTAKGLFRSGCGMCTKSVQSQLRGVQVIAKAILYMAEQEAEHDTGQCIFQTSHLSDLGAHLLARPSEMTAAEAKGLFDWCRATFLPAPIKGKDAVKDGISEEHRRIHNQEVQRDAKALHRGMSLAAILAFLKVNSSLYNEKKFCFILHSDLFKEYGEINPSQEGRSLALSGSEANNNLLIFLNPVKPTSPFFLQPTISSLTKFLRVKKESDVVAKNYLTIIEQAVSALHPDEPVPHDKEMMEKISALALRCHEWLELRKRAGTSPAKKAASQ